jgi:serine phosphatase RsbU (regulator of sigma subunit)
MDLTAVDRLVRASRVRPCRGERLSGDGTLVQLLEHGLFIAIVDVLGHGPEAHELTQPINACLAEYATGEVSAVMMRLHEQLKGTRGAAVGLCAIDAAAGRLDYVGTGNTVMRRFGLTETRLISQDGIVGQNLRTPRTQTLHMQPGDLIVLYTDGVSDRFTLDDYPGLLHHTPEQVATNIIKRFGKDHDDAACIAVRYQA